MANPKSNTIPAGLSTQVSSVEEAVQRTIGLTKHFNIDLENTIGFSVAHTMVPSPMNGRTMGYACTIWDENSRTQLVYQTALTESDALARGFSDLNAILPQWIGNLNAPTLRQLKVAGQ